jgi:hypothetical protein
MAAPSKFNPLSGGSLQITDEKRKAYPEAWIGMADDVDGASKWLRVGGISDGTTARLALAAGRTTVQGSLGVNCLPTDKALEVKGAAHVSDGLSVDAAITAGTLEVKGAAHVIGKLSVDAAVASNTTVSAGQLALSSSPAGDKATAPGMWTSLSSNAYHGDSAWHFVDTSLPAVTLEMDSRTGAARFQVWMSKKASPQAFEGRLAIDGETGTVAVYGPLTVKDDVYVKGALKDEIGLPYLSAIEVVNHNAALPATKSFKTKGRTVILLASGSGYSTTKDKTIGMDIQIDKVSRRQAKTFANEANSHNAFVAPYLVLTDLAAGDHTITLSALSGTSTDLNDYFSVVAIEL